MFKLRYRRVSVGMSCRCVKSVWVMWTRDDSAVLEYKSQGVCKRKTCYVILNSNRDSGRQGSSPGLPPTNSMFCL